MSNPNPNFKNIVGWWKGKKRPPITNIHRKNLSSAHKGQNPWNKGLKGYRAGVKHPWMPSGENHWHWRGGVTSENMKIRNCEEYRLWRNAVFARDRYTCIWCGKKSGNGKTTILHVDHIKPFALYPELRFAIDNGRTLCINCHRTTKTYAGKCRKKS
jgi:hypothetical protein